MSQRPLRRHHRRHAARAAARSPTRWPPSGKRILLLERGDFLPRETRQLGPRGGLRRRPVHRRRDAGTTPTATRSTPGSPLLRRRQHEVLRRRAVPAAAPGFRRDPPPRRPLAGVAVGLRRLRAVVRRGRVALPGARHRRRGPDRRAPQRHYPYPAVRTSRASSSSATTSSSSGCTRPTCRSASCSTRTPTASAAHGSLHPLHRVDGFPCLVDGKADAQVVAVDPALAHPNLTLLADAVVERLETDASGRTVTARGRPRATAPRRATRATWSSCRAARSTRRCCCCARRTTRIRTGSRTARTRSGATTCATTTRRSWRSRRSRTRHVFQKTLG